MTTQELYQLLELPQEVVSRLNEYARTNPQWLTPERKACYLNRATAAEGYKAILEAIGEDPDGMQLLWGVLEIARETWEGYVQRGISMQIFADTMKFVPRFLSSHCQQHGHYAFTQGWWFWRELAMEEYRIESLEYELVEENGQRCISIHIPSDADLSPAAIDASFAAFRAFLAQQYPDWTEAPWLCDSWMMSPALKELLPQGSNILAFQTRFTVESVNEDSLGVLNWVFPPHKTVSKALPERTSLQRRMKAWLLAGKKVGWAKAVLTEKP